jgi:ankyrin repeat protein
MLEERPDLLAARYIHDETPLHFCAVEGFVEGVRFLANAGVPIDAVNEFGDTALIDVVTLGRSEVVRVLLEHGAKPTATSNTRDQMLHIAVTRGDTDIVLALLGSGARTDYVTTTTGETIWDAVERSSQRKEILAALASHGVSPIKGANNACS